MQYNHYDCTQLQAEHTRITQRITELGGSLKKSADNDKALTAVTLVLFWPAVFALGGNEVQEAEYARIKGEYEAVSQASINKKCGLDNLNPTDNSITPKTVHSNQKIKSSTIANS